MWLGAIFLFVTGAGAVSLDASIAKRGDQPMDNTKREKPKT
jgi:hypothetical protein